MLTKTLIIFLYVLICYDEISLTEAVQTETNSFRFDKHVLLAFVINCISEIEHMKHIIFDLVVL